TGGNEDVTNSSGCTMPLGASPTSLIQEDGLTGLTNNGTITIASGTWTANATGGHKHNITNNGTITHSGSGWIVVGNFTNGSSGVVTYAGSTMSVSGSLDVSQGTFPSGLDLTFNSGSNQSSTFTPGSVTLGGMTINKTGGGETMAIASSVTDTGALTFTAGTLNNPGSAMTLIVQGNATFNSSGTFGGTNLTLSLEGSSNTTITKSAGTFASKL